MFGIVPPVVDPGQVLDADVDGAGKTPRFPPETDWRTPLEICMEIVGRALSQQSATEPIEGSGIVGYPGTWATKSCFPDTVPDLGPPTVLISTQFTKRDESEVNINYKGPY